MNATDLALLAAAGALPAAQFDAKLGMYPLATPAKAATGYARQVSSDGGTVTLTAFCLDGTQISTSYVLK
jgi:hypothetical protein